LTPATVPAGSGPQGVAASPDGTSLYVANERPVGGEPISFSAGGQHVCTATTDANGNAACSGVLTGVAQSVLALGYQASFTGDVAHQPASENGRLSIAAGTKLP
jgi:DNA-binding beta-propeller fold protein YncE